MKKCETPKVRLKPNVQKILGAITYIIAIAGKDNKTLTQYHIVKSLFLADKSHLNKYGRPVTFDNYLAMKMGPVPSRAYDFLKQSKSSKNKFESPPWEREAGPKGCYYYSNANLTEFEDALSESDKAALSDAYNDVTGLTISQIIDLTHSEPAYVDAWDDNSNRRSFQMSVGMLFDSPDFEQAEAVAFLSKHM